MGSEGGFAAILGADMLGSTSLSGGLSGGPSGGLSGDLSGGMTGGLGNAMMPSLSGESESGTEISFDLLSLLDDPALLAELAPSGGESDALINELSLLMQQQGGGEMFDLALLLQGDQQAITAFDNLFGAAELDLTGADIRQMLGRLDIDSAAVAAKLGNSDTPVRMTASLVTLVASLMNAVRWPEAENLLSGLGVDVALDPNEIRGAQTDADDYRAEQKRKRDELSGREAQALTDTALEDSDSALFVTNGLDPEYGSVAARDQKEIAEAGAAEQTEAIKDTTLLPSADDLMTSLDSEALDKIARDQDRPPEVMGETAPLVGLPQDRDSGIVTPKTAPVSAQDATPKTAAERPAVQAQTGQSEPGAMMPASAEMPMEEAVAKADTAKAERQPSDTPRQDSRSRDGETAPPQAPIAQSRPTGTAMADQALDNVSKAAQAAEGIKAGAGSDAGGDLGGNGGREQQGQPSLLQTARDGDAAAQLQRGDPLQRGVFAKELAAFQGSSAHNVTVAGQVALHIQRMAASRTDVLTLQLEPADLGRVDVRLEINDGRVQARIAAENPQALDQMRQDSRSLERALQNAGLNTDGGSLNFSLKDQGRSGGDQREGQGERMPVLADADTDLPNISDPAMGNAVSARALLAEGRIDWRV